MMTTSPPLLESLQQNDRDRIREHFIEDPDWLIEQRIDAFFEYLHTPILARKRTPLNHRQFENLPLVTQQPPELGGSWLSTEMSDGLLVLAGSEVAVLRPPAGRTAERVIFTDLRTAAMTHFEVVKPYLARIVREANSKFNALNRAWWQNGGFLFVPRGVQIAEPFTVVHHQVASPGFFPRSLIVLEDDSEATVIDLYVSPSWKSGPRSLAAISVEAVVGANASLHYGSIEQLALNTDAFATRAADLETNARMDWNVGSFGSGLEVSQQTTYLKGTGSENNSLTVFFGSGSQHHDLEVTSLHQGAHTRSNMIGKGVMKGRSRSIFTGVTDIKHGARGSDARQKEQTLMLSDQARADAIPSLLIEENDVLAAHAASAGPVDANAIYYLTSRGVAPEEAEQLIVEGFLAPVIDAIALTEVRQRVWSAVRKKVRE